MNTEYLKKNFGIDEDIIKICDEAEKSLSKIFFGIEKRAEYNQWKVMHAFSEYRISEAHFTETTGYGYDDIGRDTLDKVFAMVFGAEDALVRHNFISGTHTISTALFGVLRTGDTLAAITGKPYDTLEEVIGISGTDGNGSLKDYGISFEEIALKEDGSPDFEKIKALLKSKFIKAVEIQRSKGYGTRPTYSAEQIGELIRFVKSISPNTICIVDNCYGEFVDEKEPTDFGADLIAGSLIKNPGGGLAPTGGYIAGKADLVEKCAYRLTSVGIGKECGASLGFNRALYQGLFMAPHTVGQALKTAAFCAAVFSKLGFETDPKPDAERHDIIQAVQLNTPENLIAFCGGIQKGAPVDSHVVPAPWAMPGYSDEVIMAAGAFVQGASIELSADGPIRPPYTAYMQGGITYESAKLGIMTAAQKMKETTKK